MKSSLVFAAVLLVAALCASILVAAAGVGMAGAPQDDLKPVTLTFKGEKVDGPSPAAYEATSPSSTAKGDKPVIYASLSLLSPRIGATLGWLSDSRTVRVATETVVAYLTIGRTVALVNGHEKTLDAAPILIRGETFVPLVNFVRLFGYEARWDESTGTADVFLPVAKVMGVSVDNDRGHQLLVVETDRPVEHRSFILVNPDRFVLDLRGARLDKSDRQLVGQGVIRQVRLSQFDATTVRVVADLDRLVGYTVTHSSAPERIQVVFNHAVTGVRFQADGKTVGSSVPERLVVDATGPIRYTLHYLDTPRRIVLDIEGATLALPAAEKVVNSTFVRSLRQSQLDGSTVRLTLDVVEGVAARDVTPQDNPPGRLELGLLAEVNQVAVHPLDDPPDEPGKASEAERTYAVEISSAGNTLPAGVDIHKSEVGADGGSRKTVELVIDGAALAVPYDLVAAGVGPVLGVRATQADADSVKVSIELDADAKWQLAPSTGSEDAKTDSVRVLVRGGPPPPTVPRTNQAARAASGQNIVVLDPGHGGVDVGSIGRQGTLEKDITTDIARRVQTVLEARGIKTQLTRSDGNVFVGLQERAAMANALQAQALVSIHVNWFAENYAKGTETYYRQGDDRSRALAEEIHGRLVAALGTVDRGIKPAPGFVVLKQATVPAVLVEVAFLSNDNEEKLLGQPEFRQTAAVAIADGIAAFLRDGVQAPGAVR